MSVIPLFFGQVPKAFTESLRPPTPPEEMTTETKGRKSSKRKSANGDTPKRKRTAKGSDSDTLEEEELNDTALEAAQLLGTGATPVKPSPKRRRNAKVVEPDLSGNAGATPKKRNRAKPAESAAAEKEANDPATAADTAVEGGLPGKVTPEKRKRKNPAVAEKETHDPASATVIAEPGTDAVTPKKRKRRAAAESEVSEGEVGDPSYVAVAETPQMLEVPVIDKSPKRKGKKQKLATE